MWSGNVCLLTSLLHRWDSRAFHSSTWIYPMISSTYKFDILISSVIPAHCTCPHIICHSGTLKLHVLFFSYSGSFQHSVCLRCPSFLSQYLLANLSYFLKTLIKCNCIFKSLHKHQKFNKYLSICSLPTVYVLTWITHIQYHHILLYLLFKLSFK